MGWYGGTVALSFIATLMLLDAREPNLNVTVVPKSVAAPAFEISDVPCVLDCTGTGWTLYLQGDQLSHPKGALTREECSELFDEIEPQAPPFSQLLCVESHVKQQRL